MLYNVPHKFVSTIRREGERLCRFCFKPYPVDAAGNPTGSGGYCSYHPYSRPPPGQSYPCCGRARNGNPCETRSYHVTDDFDENDLTNFVYTKDLPEKESDIVYAFDCEFVNTKKGLEIASITIIDHNEEVVLDTNVKPTTPIIDYLTHFNKLTAESFENNCITDEEFCEKIKEILGPDVILVGHGCFTDLLKMRVIHDNVVDTSSLYPHPQGASFLQSLKTLSQTELDEDALPTNCTKAFLDCVRTMRIAKVAACKK